MVEVQTKTQGPVLDGRGPKIVARGISDHLDLAGQVVEGAVKLRTPVGVSGGTTSGLRGSVQASGPKRTAGGGYQNRIATPLAYGVVIEHGRRAPGPMPPVGPIELWLRRKGQRLGLPQDDTARLAFLIARKIARRGFAKKHGYKMFEQGLKDSRSQVKAILGPHLVHGISVSLNGS